jgi:hypothetical protein
VPVDALYEKRWTRTEPLLRPDGLWMSTVPPVVVTSAHQEPLFHHSLLCGSSALGAVAALLYAWSW